MGMRTLAAATNNARAQNARLSVVVRGEGDRSDHVGERAAVLGHLDERRVELLHGVLLADLPELLVAVLHVLRRHAHGGADGDGVLEADGAAAGSQVVLHVQVQVVAQVQHRPRLGGRRHGGLLDVRPRRLGALVERVHLHPQHRHGVQHPGALRLAPHRAGADVGERGSPADLRQRGRVHGRRRG
uniref:Uncharacterized protein n=1 Tax=Zea mays TaxID=4577 RepID=B7ZZB4_MAIZE|nr:unknown [Zea mays]